MEDRESILPQRVLFIGGHENFIKKVRQIYPSWTFLKPEEINSSKVKRDYALIVIQTNHVSHNIIERAKAFCKDAPVVYSNCTNVNRAINELTNMLSTVMQNKN